MGQCVIQTANLNLSAVKAAYYYLTWTLFLELRQNCRAHNVPKF